MRWLTVHDDLLAGLAHAFSNRIATVSAVASLLDASRPPDERVLFGLRQDADRLDGLLEALRRLPRRGTAALEPMMPGDGVQAALSLFAHHPDFRDRHCTVLAADNVQPVRAEPSALQHAICVALAAVCRTDAASGSAARSGVRVSLSTEGDMVRIEVASDGGADGATDGGIEPRAPAELEIDVAAIDWLLETSHGRGRASPSGCAIELPTLAASRRAS